MNIIINRITLLTATLMMVASLPLTARANSEPVMDHNKMDHSKMDHGNMKHDKMDHSKMDHSNMNHDKMVQTSENSIRMGNMSEVGMPASGITPNKVIHVILADDMSITFKKEVKIEPNDVVQFVVMNSGKMEHQFSIGSPQEQQQYRQQSEQNLHANHSSNTVGMSNSITVMPGKAAQILWHFHGGKEIEFACNEKGHAISGMVKKISL